MGGLLEAVERRGNAHEMLLRDVDIARGGFDGRMSHHSLDFKNICTRFEQVRGEAVAQGMDAAVVDPDAVADEIEDFLGRTNRHRLRAIAPEKEPLAGMETTVVVAQLAEQAVGQKGVSIFAPFSLLNTDEPARGFDVFGPEHNSFAHPQPRAIDAHD